ncbi:Hsp33 family molecular chaperone HslO [Thermaurantiacus sp.]
MAVRGPLTSPDTDRLLGFTVPGRNARGRIVRLGPVVREILGMHGYGETVARLLAEAVALAALMGALLRPEEGQVTIQALPSGAKAGPIRLLVADYLAGALRGYALTDPDRRLPVDGDLAGLFGDGRLVITLDLSATAQRYQGIVALEGPSLASAAQAYFVQSEQIPTFALLAAGRTPAGDWGAGGFIVQHLARPEAGGERLHVAGRHPDWEHVAALAATLSAGELLDSGLPLDTILWRLFHEEEVRLQAPVRLSRGCRCSEAYIRSVLMRFGPEERAEMEGADGLVSVDCAFCARRFRFDLQGRSSEESP